MIKLLLNSFKHFCLGLLVLASMYISAETQGFAKTRACLPATFGCQTSTSAVLAPAAPGALNCFPPAVSCASCPLPCPTPCPTPCPNPCPTPSTPCYVAGGFTVSPATTGRVRRCDVVSVLGCAFTVTRVTRTTPTCGEAIYSVRFNQPFCNPVSVLVFGSIPGIRVTQTCATNFLVCIPDCDDIPGVGIGDGARVFFIAVPCT